MAIFCRIFGLKTGPDGSGQPSGFIWTKFQAKRSILDPLRTKFDVFGPDWNFGQPGFGLGLALDKHHCSWEARLGFNICLVSTADICPVSAADICPVSTADICPVSIEDIYPVSTEDIPAAGWRPTAVASSVETG